MELSNRLQKIADMVTPGTVPADIGTDHGYIPIYLVKTGKCKKALAMDVREGPLARARDHVAQEGLCAQITLRLSDGMCSLQPGEADCAVIAGMGGGLVIHILEDSILAARSMQEMILAPQSELVKVRKWLYANGFVIVDEEMVIEDGKYYPIIKTLFREKVSSDDTTPALREEEYRYGPVLLGRKHPVLKQFISFEIRCTENVLAQLDGQNSQSANERKKSLFEELAFLKSVACKLE